MPVNWGILSTGNISGQFVNDFQFVEGSVVKAVASRSLEKAEQFAKQFGIERTYGTYEELARDPEIDVIYIGTPHSSHFENTQLCLQNGKHVFCEKPITVNSLQLKSLRKLAETNGLFLMEAMWMYYMPAVIQAKNWIDEGKIGRVSEIHANFGFHNNFNPSHRLYDPFLAGGALLDIGVYPISFMYFMLGSVPIDKVLKYTKAPTGVDDTISALFNFKDEQKGVMNISISHDYENHAFIYGEKGYIKINQGFWQAKRSELIKYEGKNEEFTDHRQSKGFQFEIEYVNDVIGNNRIELFSSTLDDSQNIVAFTDIIRKEIGLKYPFE